MYASITTSEHESIGARQRYQLDRLGGAGRIQLCLWDAAPETGEYYQVEFDFAGTSAEPATVASVLTFAGPVSPAHKAAAEFAQQHRIRPAMADQPGLVRVLTLWDADRRRQMVIVLNASLAELEAGGKRIATMALLPGEDEALLPGPDTMEIYRVQPQPAEAGAR